MQNENWGKWLDWLIEDGQQPPVPVGTWVDAYLMNRPGQAEMAARREVFKTATGDSFRALADLVDPAVPTAVVYRYRVWEGEDTPERAGVLEAEGPVNPDRIDRDGRVIAAPERIAHVGDWEHDPFVDAFDELGVRRTYLWLSSQTHGNWNEISTETHSGMHPVWSARAKGDDGWRAHLPEAAVTEWGMRQVLMLATP